MVDTDNSAKWCANSTPDYYYDNTSSYLGKLILQPQLASPLVQPALGPQMMTALHVLPESSSLLLARVAISATLTSTLMALIFATVRLNNWIECDGACDGCTGAGNTLCSACKGTHKEI